MKRMEDRADVESEQTEEQTKEEKHRGSEGCVIE